MLLHSISISLTVPNPELCNHHNNNKIFSFKNSLLSNTSYTNSLTRLSASTSKRALSLNARYSSDYFEQQRVPSAPPNNTSFQQPPPERDGFPSRVYVGHSIYKGKAAVTVEPKAPEFSSLESGAFKVSKEGYVLLQFAPAAGVRLYDWSRKQVFSLSVTEIGSLISLGSRESCEFFHDPNKGRSDEGKVRKVLKVEPLQDGSGHLFNLNVQNKLLNVDDNIYIPITKAELAVLVAAFKVWYSPTYTHAMANANSYI
ncbi:Whirly transcription factor, partial [Dillenia turbinata]